MINKYQIAICQYGLEKLNTWKDFSRKISSFCKQTREAGASLILLPEYLAFELTSFIAGDLAKQFATLQNYLRDYQLLFQTLAKNNNLYILAGSFPVANKNGKYFNRAFFVTPNGKIYYQDKCFLIRYECEINLLARGDHLKVFITPLGNIAINICYDVELPSLLQQQVLHPVDLLLVPSCTETLAGLNRVQISCRARAIEQQIFVAQSGLQGTADYCDFINLNISQCGIYAPSDIGFPESGIIIEGRLGATEICYAEIDLNKLKSLKQESAVTNAQDLKQIKPIPLQLINLME